MAARALKWTGIVAGALILILVLALVVLDHTDLRGPVSRIASTQLGQPVRITRSLDLNLFSMTPGAVVAGLELGKPKSGSNDPIARVERLTVNVRLLPLLSGHIVLPRLILEKPDLHLSRSAAGDANWQTKRGKKKVNRPPNLPLVQHFVVTDGRLSLEDELRELSFNGTFEARETAGDRSPLRLSSRGELNGQAFRFDLRGGSLVNVRRNRPYPFEYDVIAGATRMKARGSVARPFDLANYQAVFNVSGEDLADLYYFTDLALPNTPPYRVAGHVQRAGDLVYLSGVTGQVGDSDIDVEATVDMKGDRPHVKADVVSRSLDLDDLGASLGGAPSTKPGETASLEDRARAQSGKPRRIFNDSTLKVNRLRAMDADVQFEAEAVQARKVPLRKVSVRVRLEDGVLTLDPVSFVLPQGQLSGTARIDARQDLPETTLDARITGLQLGQFKPRKAKDAPLEGKLVGRAQLKGYGDSIHETVSTSDGTVTFVLPKGEVREVLAELTGINVARGLGLLMRKDEDHTPVRCGVAEFGLKNGTLQTKNIVVDTDNVLISGRGEIDLEAESYDLEIEGKPKKLRLFRVRSPIAIQGPLTKPDIGPRTGESLTQTGVAAALATVVAPLAAVLAFVDPGLADDANCRALLAEAKREGAPVKTADVKKADRG